LGKLTKKLSNQGTNSVTYEEFQHILRIVSWKKYTWKNTQLVRNEQETYASAPCILEG